MTDKPTIYNIPKISRDPLDSIQIGDWYWVKFDDTKWDGEKDIKAGSHEDLMCVEEIGSNFVGFTRSIDHGTQDARVHFNEFFATCRSEPNWKPYLQDRMNELQAAIQAKTKELIEHGRKLFLLDKPKDSPTSTEEHSLLPMKVADEPKRYKKELVKLKDKTLPTISKEIDKLAVEYAVTAKDLSLPDLVKLNIIKKKLSVVGDRIFTIELYCGLQETVHQIAEGEPAKIEEKIAVRQALLFMDEETLFDYEDGGMDFNSIKKFDAWVVKPENLNRILPEQKSIVAFKVRRYEKDYGTPSSLLQAWAHIQWGKANEWTYLLIRNGQNVYRIASEIDFSPRLIPMRNEIGEEQFKKVDHNYVWEDDGPSKRIETETLITRDSTEFDDHVKKVDQLLKQYNRIVILIQGLLDRSKVFHPHPPINLVKPGVLDEWVRLIRDEEDGLPCNKITFEEYQKQLNKTLRKGKWVFVDNNYNERYADGEEPYREGSHYRVRQRRGWAVNTMPKVCQVESINRDHSKVQVSWPWGKLSNPIETGRWIPSKTKPGYGHYEYRDTTDRMCHEQIPITRVLNVTDYQLGDYKMFLCDRALSGKYLEWSQYLLNAEDWARNRAKGIPAEKDKLVQVKQ